MYISRPAGHQGPGNGKCAAGMAATMQQINILQPHHTAKPVEPGRVEALVTHGLDYANERPD